ncbi:ABC transporter ATP-binding protein [Arenibacter sp. GZD96]|uniref:ABC transporter ATP-binding protein n=1 Tax=Aurantibrevibacter litoralis TaxID=3106030 RepID=UPI002AFEA021|nr:ABC transporter ATP-binding protein [Arenibacter sp. GZD-96]MEA1784468.1 ABC transporter ATP-binding protein [Arenibacter sp. GZD-96]
MLKVEKLTFAYDNVNVLKNIDFTLPKGKFLAVMGESGGGKSTLLKLIYGLLQLEEGTIFWKDAPVLGPNFNLVPGESYMKFLSQDFDLMPFISVEENVGQYLSVFEPKVRQARISELLHMVEMSDYASVKVKNLSGGQQQRVALAQVLAQEPELLLLDEPFSHIDNFRKNSLRRNLFSHLKKANISCIVATHDMDDVLSFADEILVLKDQKMCAKATPIELYSHPKTAYIASLFGEVTLVPMTLLKSYSEINKSILVYPNEFLLSDKSGIKVIVKNTFYKGAYYLTEGVMENEQPIFFNSKYKLQTAQPVFLNVALETVNVRLKDLP